MLIENPSPGRLVLDLVEIIAALVTLVGSVAFILKKAVGAIIEDARTNVVERDRVFDVLVQGQKESLSSIVLSQQKIATTMENHLSSIAKSEAETASILRTISVKLLDAALRK